MTTIYSALFAYRSTSTKRNRLIIIDPRTVVRTIESLFVVRITWSRINDGMTDRTLLLINFRVGSHKDWTRLRFLSWFLVRVPAGLGTEKARLPNLKQKHLAVTRFRTGYLSAYKNLFG